ncbi:MAG: NADH-quinone oxidoreductase subunit N, partial [Pseudomonadota bacterium]
MTITPDLFTAGPEIILAVGAMALLMVGVFRKDDSFDLISMLSLLLLAGAAGALVFGGQDGETAFGGQFINDSFARFMKVLTLFGSAVTIMMSISFMKRRGIERFEYPVLVVLATLGILMMISANYLVALFMGLELQSL